MPLDHTGALSGVTYRIPALADVRDPSKGFADFADTLPPTPPVIEIEAVTADHTAEANHLYVYEGSTGIAITLPGTAAPSDKVLVVQLGTGLVTVNGVSAGVPVTAGQNTAVSAVWDGTRWVGLPFSFSGTRPGESTGGTKPPVDINGFRYHIFDAPGTYTFISHKALHLEAVVLGAGGGGETSSLTAIGPGGAGGEVLLGQSVDVGDWTFTPVVVGAGGAVATDGGASSFGSLHAAGGAGGHAGQTTPPSTPGVLSGDWATALAATTVGGPGADGAGPVAPARPGIGGSGGFDLLESYPQETESYSYTTGGPYQFDCSYPARSYQEQTGTTQIRGDTRPVYCPDGWRVSLVEHASVQCQNIANPSQVAYNGWMGGCPGGWYPCGMNCCTDQPVYETRYACDSGGSSNGAGTCVKTCSGDNTQHHTGTRPKACNAGYTAVNGMCVDSRAAGGGRGGDGLVSVRYPLA